MPGQPRPRPFAGVPIPPRATSAPELIDRATLRADWARRALEHAAEDLAQAGGRSVVLEGLTEAVVDQAAAVDRLAQDIACRRSDFDGGRW
jgi:hypothetical protein